VSLFEIIASSIEKWAHLYVNAEKSSVMMFDLESLCRMPSLAKLLSLREPTCVQELTENMADSKREEETYIICESVH